MTEQERMTQAVSAVLAQWKREERRDIAWVYLGAFVICPAAVIALFFLI